MSFACAGYLLIGVAILGAVIAWVSFDAMHK